MTSNIQHRPVDPTRAYAVRQASAGEQAQNSPPNATIGSTPLVGPGLIKAAVLATTLAALPEPAEARYYGGCYGCYSNLSTHAKIGIAAGIGGMCVLAIAIACLCSCCSARSSRSAYRSNQSATRPDVEMGTQTGRTGVPDPDANQDTYVVMGIPVSYEPQWSPPMGSDHGTMDHN